jgi:pimeloyl-ACP methyl ester carboxylesterase
MATRLPHATLRVFEDAGHMMFVESPDAFLDTVAGFIGGLNR